MCGVFGIWGHPEAAHLAYLGLHALQHRGQESAGIVSTDGKQLYAHRAMGLVHDVFSQADLKRLPGSAAIGQVRYSTAGGSHVRNAQPLAVDYARGSIAVAHNGNLTNARELREKLEEQGSIFISNSDTEVIVHRLARSTQRSIDDRIAEALRTVKGAYSLVFLTEQELIAARDPMGFRPLFLGTVTVPGTGDKAYVVASEATSFNLIGAEFVREIEPGELLVINASGIVSSRRLGEQERKLCIFEYVYFARPDSVIDDRTVYHVRKSFGRRLAQEQPARCDVVVPVPDSGLASAFGYAQEIGHPCEMGLIRSHYVGRTFIEPQQTIRNFGVRLKFSPVAEAIRGKSVVLIDDSIVRGTTMRKIVAMLRDAGASEVHVRISSPPTLWPCYYGIDTPSRTELIAATHSLAEICDYMGAASLGYLSVEGMHAALAETSTPRSASGCNGFCDACFTGNYPVPFDQSIPPRRLRLIGV